MAGVGEPDLIIRGAGSPHAYSLKPSEARLLEGAQVIFWVGESLETFMEKPLAALGSKARVVQVMRMPGITLLAGRAGGAWEDHDGHGATDHGHEPGRRPRVGRARRDVRRPPVARPGQRARSSSRDAAEVLGRIDPENRGRYAANAAALVARIDALDAGLKAALAPVRDIPFVVFHDAYQYFEKSYALRAVGSITVSAERNAGGAAGERDPGHDQEPRGALRLQRTAVLRRRSSARSSRGRTPARARSTRSAPGCPPVRMPISR